MLLTLESFRGPAAVWEDPADGKDTTSGLVETESVFFVVVTVRLFLCLQ